MHLTTAIARFSAGAVLPLLLSAAKQRRDEIWLIRCERCYLTSPDCPDEITPASVVGDKSLVFDACMNPRVEVLELHNHIFRSLTKATSPLKGWYVEVHFNDEGDFCLALCQGTTLRRPRKGTKPMSWMNCRYDRRLF